MKCKGRSLKTSKGGDDEQPNVLTICCVHARTSKWIPIIEIKRDFVVETNFSRMGKGKQENIPNTYADTRFLLPDYFCPKRTSLQRIHLWSILANITEYGVFQQKTKVIHDNIILTMWSSSIIQSRFFRNTKIVRKSPKFITFCYTRLG